MNNKRKKNGRSVLALTLTVIMAAVMLLGGCGGGGSKYDEKFAEGTDYFAEGDYERAKEAYLSAVEIDNKRTEARVCLAFISAIEGDYDGAKKAYEDLYEETGDERYKTAAEETGKGMIPSDMTLIPLPEAYRAQTEEALSALNTEGVYICPVPENQLGPSISDSPDWEYYETWEVAPEMSNITLNINSDGTFTASFEQFEWFAYGHQADLDVLRRATAAGRFISTGKDENGAYILKPIVLVSVTGEGDRYTEEYTVPSTGEVYWVDIYPEAFTESRGFGAGDTFIVQEEGSAIADTTNGMTFKLH